MKLSIIGASAGVGLQTVMQALERGHEVTALSRDTSAMPENALLHKINGSATLVADLKMAIKDADAVIITIGTKDKKGTILFSETANALIKAVNELEFKHPVLIVTGFGAGLSANYLNFLMRTVIKLFLKDQYINKTLMEELLVKSAIKWVMVRPGMLTNGPLTKTYRSMKELYKGIKIGKISRADVAHFLVSEVENPKMLHQYVSLSS